MKRYISDMLPLAFFVDIRRFSNTFVLTVRYKIWYYIQKRYIYLAIYGCITGKIKTSIYAEFIQIVLI